MSQHGYSVSVTGVPFTAVHGDLITEWFNKQTKGKGGPFRSGYSTKISSLNTYVRTMHIHADLHQEMKTMLMINTSSTHKEMILRSMKRHRRHVHNLKDILLNIYAIDLFSNDPPKSIATSEEIDANIIRGLIGSKDIVNKRFIEFVEERLVEGKKSFFDRIKKNNIPTGNEAKKKKKTKEVVLLREDRQAFGYIAAKAIPLNESLEHCITKIPHSIAISETKLYQSDKSGMKNMIIDESNSCMRCPPMKASWIIDCMAIIRPAKPERTYKDFFKKILSSMMPRREYQALTLEIITDTYIQQSTKHGTREARGEESTRIHITGLGQLMPDTDKSWQGLLCNSIIRQIF